MALSEGGFELNTPLVCFVSEQAFFHSGRIQAGFWLSAFGCCIGPLAICTYPKAQPAAAALYCSIPAFTMLGRLWLLHGAFYVP